MTVIAYDGKTLASDTLSVSGSMKGKARKLYEVIQPDGTKLLLGIAGSYAACLGLVEWIRGGCDPEAAPEDAAADELMGPSACVMAIDAAGQCWLYEGASAPMLERSGFWAIGSGAETAIAAMSLGKTAVEAVQLAIRISHGCGGEVETLTHEPEITKPKTDQWFWKVKQ